MANKNLNKLLAKMERQCREITPSVYASIAIALHRKCGWGYKRISDLFAESQEVWNECIQGDISMIEMCEKETGINVANRVGE